MSRSSLVASQPGQKSGCSCWKGKVRNPLCKWTWPLMTLQLRLSTFQWGSFTYMGSAKSPQSLLEVGIAIIIIPIRRGRRLRLKLLSIALEEWGWGWVTASGGWAGSLVLSWHPPAVAQPNCLTMQSFVCKMELILLDSAHRGELGWLSSWEPKGQGCVTLRRKGGCSSLYQPGTQCSTY